MDSPQNYVCGPCGQKFESSAEMSAVDLYRAHICPVSGFAPTDPRNLGPEFAEISKAALERGANAIQTAEAPIPPTVS